MNQSQIFDQLAGVFREVFDSDEFDFSANLERGALESWDSLGHIRLVSAIEESFSVSFTMDEIELLTSTAKIAEVLQQKI